MSAWCGERSSGWSLSGPESNLEEGLRLLRARFRSPNVEPGTLEKLVAIEIGQHKDNKLEMNVIKNALVQWSERGEKSPVLLEFSDAELKALKEAELKARSWASSSAGRGGSLTWARGASPRSRRP